MRHRLRGLPPKTTNVLEPRIFLLSSAEMKCKAAVCQDTDLNGHRSWLDLAMDVRETSSSN